MLETIDHIFILFCDRKLLETIDQTEFEGFEYINPLLMSSEESVWFLEFITDQAILYFVCIVFSW